jgi:hypothetical protein
MLGIPMRTPPLLASLSIAIAVTAALSAQGTVVSPAGLANLEGNSSNAYPRWGNTSVWIPRYMQIHSDLGWTPLVLKQLALRQNGNAAAFAGPTTLDVEVFVGSSVSWDQASWVYANNYVLPPTNVIPRTMLNIQNVGGGATPNPFDIKFPFGTPVVYLPTYSLAWEIRAHASSGAQTPGPDAHTGSSGTGGGDAVTGAGCTASGQSQAMLLSGGSAANGSAFTLGYYVDYGPANAPTFLAIGATNPSLTFPGLCGQVYTDLVVTHNMGLTDATGFLGEYVTATSKIAGGANAFAFPNTFPGAALYLQAHAIDIGSPNVIKVSSSNGRKVTVPAPNLATVVPATRIYGFNVGTGALNPNAVHVTSSIGYVVPVQFTY